MPTISELIIGPLISVIAVVGCVIRGVVVAAVERLVGIPVVVVAVVGAVVIPGIAAIPPIVA